MLLKVSIHGLSRRSECIVCGKESEFIACGELVSVSGEESELFIVCGELVSVCGE